MNLLLLLPEDIVAPDRARVGGRRADHVRGLLRKSVGDDIVVGQLHGLRGRARIVSDDGEVLELSLDLHDDPPPRARVTRLVLALPRPPMLRRILEHTAALGIEHLVLLHSARVEKSFWDSHDLRPDAIAQRLHLGLEQAGDTQPPHVQHARRFRPFVEDVLPGLAAGTRPLLATPAAEASPVPPPGPVTLIVGPEGGLVPSEIDHLHAAGCVAWSLGPRILRVETAVVAALGRLG